LTKLLQKLSGLLFLAHTVIWYRPKGSDALRPGR